MKPFIVYYQECRQNSKQIPRNFHWLDFLLVYFECGTLHKALLIYIRSLNANVQLVLVFNFLNISLIRANRFS